jgi:hypothetical protein
LGSRYSVSTKSAGVMFVCLLAIAATLACGIVNPGSKSGSGSGSSLGTLQGIHITTMALNGITDPTRLDFLIYGGGAVDCYPGATLSFSAFEIFTSDVLQGEVAQPAPPGLNWSTSDSTIATVDKNGTVTCVATGQIFMNAELPNATCAVSCKTQAIVMVGSAKHTLTLTPAGGAFHMGDAIDFTGTLNTEVAGGSITTQDVSSSIQIANADSLNGNGLVLTLAAVSATTNNDYKATAAGTAWGYASYSLPSGASAFSNVFTITVQ